MTTKCSPAVHVCEGYANETWMVQKTVNVLSYSNPIQEELTPGRSMLYKQHLLMLMEHGINVVIEPRKLGV